ncbi:TA system antitoxin ParD family protein [Wenxinia saemankumensis]|uniref:ParD-like antitoxin of type II toxin-antitoxin system n=1 Tax=Wenxinia saemankumensis TaxID=1447782 RepID=A0A1M6I2U1_9RHOB|nr:hypothetical protein [Wenxinia saemankumensis]SHJ28584.1 ParD-like antitoxin of type II toxin-antitoxin system [Wenxinia saemankumensis]
MKPTLSIAFDDRRFFRAAASKAQRTGRTLSQQICHWARIGRRAELDGFYDEERVQGALSAKVDTAVLLPVEGAVWEERFIELMSRPGPGEIEFFRELREQLRSKGTGNPEGTSG